MNLRNSRAARFASSVGVSIAVVASSLVGVAAIAPAAQAATYTAADVALHNTATNCWVILSGNVYDLSVFQTKHSGGASKITGQCGKDGTATFTGQHGSLTKSINTTVTGGNTTFGTYLSQYMLGALVVATAPAAPTGLTATAGNAQVALSWTASTGATSYTIYRNGTQVGTSTTTTYTATGLTNGTAYSFTVSATNATGTSAQSTAVSATPVAPVTIPAAPTGLTATAGNAQVTLTWTASTGATSYTVFQGATQIGTATTTSYTATGLTNGTAYSFTVKAVNSAGTSTASNTATATPVAPATAPAAPTGLAAVAGNAQVVLTWNATAGATSYQILRGGTQIGTSTTPTYTATGLTNGTAYSFTVKAVNAVGTSAASAAVSATPQVGAPAAPTGLTATAGNAQVALTWTASAGATSYTIFRNGTQVGTSTTTSYTATGLTNGTSYSFTVTATNAGGTSAASAPASATPVAPVTAPAAPTGLKATAGDAQVDLTWTASTGATSYTIFQGATQIGTATTPAFTVTGLTNGTSYSFTVKAVNSGGTSAASAAVSATPKAPVYPTTPISATTLATHNTAANCWVAINGIVYDLTVFLTTHSGGPAVITSVCGKDGTALFTGQHGSALASHVAVIAPNQVGTYTAPPTTPVNGSYTKADIAKHNTTSNCWVGVEGIVYDLTSFINTHSGGSGIIAGVCGTDGTATFWSHHAPGSKTANLAAYKVGTQSDYIAGTPPAPITVDALPGGGKYTMAEVAKHSTADDCWTVINGGVYGLSTFMSKHPGGTAPLVALCGVDGTGSYNAKHGGNGTAGALLAKLRMGDLVADPSAPAPAAPKTYTLADVQAHNTKADCWSVINGYAYDLTKWISKHPGGPDVIIALCGKDGTASYNGMHSKSATAAASLGNYVLGAVTATATPTTVKPTQKFYTLPQVKRHAKITNCWTTVKGGVYNITPWAKAHSKTATVKTLCGKNATAGYKGAARTAKVLKPAVLKKYRIGTLKATKPAAKKK